MVSAVTFLFVFTCFLNFNVEASYVKSNDFFSDLNLQDEKGSFNHKFEENNDIEWFDGSFKGLWGKTKDYSDGELKGNLNFGRTSYDGKFFCELNDYEGSFQKVKGFFKNNFLTGFINSDDKIIPELFFGKISIYENNFSAVIFILKTGIIYVKGEYDGSFLPPLTGSYGIGIKNLHLIDESRPEYFTKNDPDDFREMMVQISYPIDKETPLPSVEYMDDPTFAWLKDRSPIPLFTIPDDAYTFVNPHGIISGSISEDKDMYPVIVFSPGYDGVYQIYTSLIEDIVSNGFIVVSINHPYISGITVFPDGRKVYVSRNSTGDIGIRSVVEDAKFVLDKITELNNTDPILKGKFDLSKVGMYGHSFGGASTSICCYEDDRFLCGLTLDGVFYLDYIPDGLKKPFLLMLAEDRFNDENAQDMWNNLNGDSYKVEIIGSTHYAYTDVGLLLNHLVPMIPNNILGFGTIEPKRHVNITRNFELAFFNVYLKDMPIDDLIDLGSYFEEVNFEFK